MSEINCNNCAISDFKESLCKRCDKMKRIGSADDIEKLIIGCLPSEQPEWKWIPCSERLPDMHDEVLVTARGEVSIAWLYVDGKWRSNDMPQPMFRDIIAWMPLPEPWKEGEADGNQH